MLRKLGGAQLYRKLCVVAAQGGSDSYLGKMNRTFSFKGILGDDAKRYPVNFGGAYPSTF